MRFSVAFFLSLVLLPSLSFARIGDSLEQLTERYGTANRLYDKEGGLTIVEYRKEGLDLEFTLLELKTEAVKIHGKLNQKEAEVFMARNVPVGTSFDLLVDPPTPYQALFKFWKAYSFSDESRAYFFSDRNWSDGYGTLVIESAKIRAYKYWKKMEDEKRELEDANKRIDEIEKKKEQQASTQVKSSFNPTKLSEPKIIAENGDGGSSKQLGFVEVTGEVRAPQRVPMREYLTLLGAIAECGGFTDFANRRRVQLIRKGDKKEYNAREIMRNPEADILLQPNDQIFVSRSIF